MNRISAQFQVVKISENQYDLLLFSSEKVLKSFQKVYPNSIFIEKSKFERPLVAIPDFETKHLADIFIQYWLKAFENPDESCQSCSLVKEFFASVGQSS